MEFKSMLILFFFSAATLFSCSNEASENPQQKEEPQVKTEIDNRVTKSNAVGTRKFTVNKLFCKQTDLPIINFSLDYPSHLETDIARPNRKDYNYNAFFKKDNKGKQIENISLGYYTPSNMNPIVEAPVKLELLQQVGDIWGTLFQLSDVTLGEQNFDGKKYYMLRANGKIPNPNPDLEFEGTYLIQSLILDPQKGNKNGLLVSFFANEHSDIKSFDDFATKGDISTVWRSLTFE